MQRRDVLTGLAAAAMCAPWIAISNPYPGPASVTVLGAVQHMDDAPDMDDDPDMDPIPDLVPVFERLPEALATPRHPGQPARFPLVIGLGRAAQQLVDQIGPQPWIPPDAALYRSGPPAHDSGLQVQHGSEHWLRQRLEVCDSALLLIDTADPRALGEGLVWARQLATHAVELRAALLLNTRTATVPEAWRRALGEYLIGAIELRTRGATLDVRSTLRVFLQGLPFMQKGLFGYRPADFIWALSAGACARTTAVQWSHATILPVAIRAASRCLDVREPRGLLAWIHAHEDFTIGEYDAIRAQCERLLPEEGRGMIAVNLHPEWPKPRKVLNLILVGEADMGGSSLGHG